VRGSQDSLATSRTFFIGPFRLAKSAVMSRTGRKVCESTHSSR
jgi:hypothetical protein